MGGRPQAASLVQGLRPRNAPLQKHASPTMFTLPQRRVWRTESPPPLAASSHRPSTANLRCSPGDWCSTENKKLKTKNCSSGRSAASGPSLCRGCAPATPPKASHLVHSSPATCLASSVSSPSLTLSTIHCSSACESGRTLCESRPQYQRRPPRQDLAASQN